jgi:hypothetical protein
MVDQADRAVLPMILLFLAGEQVVVVVQLVIQATAATVPNEIRMEPVAPVVAGVAGLCSSPVLAATTPGVQVVVVE